ncbi:MAG: hypothetical protein EA356_09140 [Geminicoccaceae bacterium]|nr:MAG: hypothetical protein EA356_09140 [Geminicoccaceae bacterium]
MTETTRALAQLPSLDVELVHDRTDDGSAERLAIRLTGRPDLKTAARMIEPALLQGLAGSSPWLAAPQTYWAMQQALWRQAMEPWVRLNPFLAPLLPPPDRPDDPK